MILRTSYSCRLSVIACFHIVLCNWGVNSPAWRATFPDPGYLSLTCRAGLQTMKSLLLQASCRPGSSFPVGLLAVSEASASWRRTMSWSYPCTPRTPWKMAASTRARSTTCVYTWDCVSTTTCIRRVTVSGRATRAATATHPVGHTSILNVYLFSCSTPTHI